MISLADVSGLVSPIEKYKPWWETAVNLILQLLLIITIVIWGSVFLSSQNLMCIPKNSTTEVKTKFGIVEANFLNAKCLQEQRVEVITMIPYFLFLIWLSCYLIHNVFWIMPWMSSRFENLLFALKEFQKLTPNNVETVLDNLKKGKHIPFEYVGRNKVVIADALKTKLSEKERLLFWYIIFKCTLFVFLVGGCCLDGYFCCSLLWKMMSGVIHCYLSQEIANFKHFTCIFLPGGFIMWAVVFHGILLVLAAIFCIISICKTITCKNVPQGGYAIIGEGNKGQKDAKFFVWLIQQSTKDGGLTRHRLLFSAKSDNTQTA